MRLAPPRRQRRTKKDTEWDAWRGTFGTLRVSHCACSYDRCQKEGKTGQLVFCFALCTTPRRTMRISLFRMDSNIYIGAAPSSNHAISPQRLSTDNWQSVVNGWTPTAKV